MLGRFIVLLILLCIIYLMALFIISNSSQLRKKIYFLATASVILGFIAIWREMELEDVYKRQPFTTMAIKIKRSRRFLTVVGRYLINSLLHY